MSLADQRGATEAHTELEACRSLGGLRSELTLFGIGSALADELLTEHLAKGDLRPSLGPRRLLECAA